MEGGLTMSERIRIRRGLLSVSDKAGLVDFARGLTARDVAIVSTGGTARALTDADVPITEISEFTGSPEILGGRVKTLHPKVHGGILYRRDLPGDVETVSEQGIEPIDLVVVNLYPFEQTVAREGVTLTDALENIDIGGPTLLRAAAKNWPHVVVVCDPADYAAVLAEMDEGGITPATRRRLATKAFGRCAAYNTAITDYLERDPQVAGGEENDGVTWPEFDRSTWSLRQSLRYGENPHQPGAFYVPATGGDAALAGLEKLQGTEISYNNLLDLDGGWRLAQALTPPVAVVVKHRNPCGAAEADDLLTAFRDAWAGDSLSAFGGVVVVRGRIDEPLARAITENFVEVVAAESLDEAALAVFSRKKRLRVLVSPGLGPAGQPLSRASREIRSVAGGLLHQGTDVPETAAEWSPEVVTERAPTTEEMAALRFAWQVVRYVQSNAIVFARGTHTVGVGSGQTSRVDAVELAIRKAGREGHDLAGSVMASDAFFPFGDSVQAAAAVGCTAVVQPGGSKRDAESIEAANAAGMTMVFTGRRSFRH